MSHPPFSRVLLTGGNGFVGRHFAPMLVAFAPEAERLMLVRPGSPAEAGWASAAAEIDDREDVGAIVRSFRPDLVLHLAAQASVGAGQGAAEDTWRVNFDGSFALAAACARHAPQATFLFVSSGEVYGASFNEGPATEDTPLRPQNAYARSKAAAELMLADVLPAGSRLVVARAFNQAGAGQDERFALPSFAAQIARIEAGRQEPVMRVGNLEAARDFLDVRDVCDAYLALLQAAPNLPHRTVFNISSGMPRTLSRLLDILRADAKVRFEVRPDPERLRPSDVPIAAGRNDRLSGAVGWGPRRSIESTLRDVLEDARQRVAAR